MPFVALPAARRVNRLREHDEPSRWLSGKTQGHEAVFLLQRWSMEQAESLPGPKRPGGVT